MALYDYKCPNCKRVTEHLHGMNETPEYICEKCGTRLIKKFTPTTSIIIGDNFKAVSNPKWVDEKIEKIHGNPDADPYAKHRDKPL